MAGGMECISNLLVSRCLSSGIDKHTNECAQLVPPAGSSAPLIACHNTESSCVTAPCFCCAALRTPCGMAAAVHPLWTSSCASGHLLKARGA